MYLLGPCVRVRSPVLCLKIQHIIFGSSNQRTALGLGVYGPALGFGVYGHIWACWVQELPLKSKVLSFGMLFSSHNSFFTWPKLHSSKRVLCTAGTANTWFNTNIKISVKFKNVALEGESIWLPYGFLKNVLSRETMIFLFLF